MGFDNECIQNIQSLAGEYFCPVCRLLVYPDEALYTQCTHLYCKPCLAYVVSTTRTCPYDGYPVAEADAKPVTEANKALAETIGRIAVNCLYHRSGCTWQGTLSETTAHCAGCAFGNSPVVCNRCGTQIVHRQVQEHAQICPGEQPLAQQADNATAGTEQNQAATQAGAPASQSQSSETAAAPAAGQGQNQGASNAQPQAVPQVAPTPEQWYQQQQQYYQQYYQQYPGYDPYQQQYQQYIQYQQQLQAHPQQVIQGQPQPQPYVQPQSQPQPQTQVHPQPQAPLQGQAQAPAHPQPHPQPQTQPQAQPHPHLQPQPAAQPQIQGHAPQPQPHASVQSHPQMQPQSHAQPVAQQQVGHFHPQGQPHLQLHPQQHPQMTQHPQPHPQMQHPQPHPHPQSHPRPHQPQPQPQAYPQPHLQHHPQPQPQPQPQPHPQPPSQMQPHSLSQPQHPAAQAVTGHQSYPQPQPYQQIPPVAPQHPVHMHPQQQGAPHQVQHPVQMQSQFPQQQPSQVRPPQNLPPHSHVQQHPQQQVMMPTQGQHPHAPPVQQQLAHHPGQQIHHQPGMQPPQQQSLPQQQPHYPQQQAHALAHQPQPFPGQAPGVVHNQQHQQSSFAPPHAMQQPQQSLRPQGLPLQQQAHSHPQLQQNIPVAQSLPTHHPQSLSGRPMLPNQGALHQPLLQTPVGSAGPVLGQDIHVGGKMSQLGVGQPSWATNCLKLVPDQQVGPSQQSLLPRSDSQSTLLPVSPSSGTNALLSSANASLKQVLPEKNQVDSVPGKVGEVPKLDADGTNVNASVTNNEAATKAEMKIPKAENDMKSSEGEDKILGGSDDKNVNEMTDSSVMHGKDHESSENVEDLEEPVIKQMVKDETSEKLESTGDAKDEKELEASQHAVKEVHVGLPHNLEVQDVKLRQEAVDLQVPRPWSDASGSVQSHLMTDKGPQGHALGTFSDRNIHAQHPQNAIQGYDRAVPHSAYPDRNLPQFPRHVSVPDEHRGLLSPGQLPSKNFVQPSHQTAVPDQERYRQLLPYGPSPHMQDRAPQRPAAPDRMLPSSIPLPGPERNFQEQIANQMQMQGPPMVHMRPQGHNALESFPQHQQGQPSSVQDHFQTPMAKQPHNSFHSELPPAGFPGRAMPTVFGREPGLLGPPQGFEPHPTGPHGHRQGLMPPPYPGGQRTPQGEPLSGVPPGAFDSAGSMMPRGPLGPEGRPRPANPIEAEMLANKRPGFFEGKGPVGVQDTAFLHGLKEERYKPFPEDKYTSGLEEGFKPPPEDRFKPFPLDPGRRVIDRREFEEDLKQFPRPSHLDGENLSRPLDRGSHVFGDRPPHLLSHDIGLKSDGNAGIPSGSGGSFHPVDTGDRLRLSRPDNLGRTADPSGAPPDFLRHVSEFGRHRMDNLPPLRSPGREHSGLPPSRFGSSPAGLGLGSHPGLNDFDGRDLRGFGERRSGALPAPLRRGEFDGPGNLRINEQLGSGRPVHLRSGDMGGPDVMPIHLRGVEPFGAGSLLNHVRSGDLRNLPGHLRVGEPLGPSQLHIGEPTGYGGIPSDLRIGGPGHLPPHLRIGETVGAGSFPSHMRIGEPGFGSGFPMQGLQGSLQGDMESFEHSRKRKPGSTGWCRICKVDCETLEGLELHSQTREHQKAAMDMVLSIKQDNSKKQKLSSEENASREDANKPKKASFENRGTRN